VELQKLIDERRAGFAAVVTSVDRGRAVFEKACAVCHQRDGQGAVVGPQLDGLGTRGLERIVEDVLDPNRNADPAFTPSLITLKDDTSITGLLRREEGEMLVFVDTLGKEVAVPKNEITERRESQLSLMPANFGEVLTVAEFHDLMAFLLE
jgi:putative heme-binding domain-containing protein